jgi:hypothetical protein
VASALNDGKPTPKPQPTEPPAPPGRPAIADDADDLKMIRSAVVDASGVSTGLWLSYLFVLYYLLVAAGGVTHRDLFFENPIKLPFLSVLLLYENGIDAKAAKRCKQGVDRSPLVTLQAAEGTDAA